MSTFPKNGGGEAQQIINSSVCSPDKKLKSSSPRLIKPRVRSLSAEKTRPDLPSFMKHLLAEFFSEEENLQHYFQDIDGICAGT